WFVASCSIPTVESGTITVVGSPWLNNCDHNAFTEGGKGACASTSDCGAFDLNSSHVWKTLTAARAAIATKSDRTSEVRNSALIGTAARVSTDEPFGRWTNSGLYPPFGMTSSSGSLSPSESKYFW